VLSAKTSRFVDMMQSRGSCPHVSMPTLTYNRASRVIKENATILNIIHNIFNLRDTEVVICMLLVLYKRGDGINHLNIRYYTRSS